MATEKREHIKLVIISATVTPFPQLNSQKQDWFIARRSERSRVVLPRSFTSIYPEYSWQVSSKKCEKAGRLPETSYASGLFSSDALETEAAAKAAGPVWSLRITDLCPRVSVCMPVTVPEPSHRLSHKRMERLQPSPRIIQSIINISKSQLCHQKSRFPPAKIFFVVLWGQL